MKNRISGLIIFTAGVVTASAATWLVVKKRYEQIAQEEIESVRELYRRKEKDFSNKKSDSKRCAADETSNEVTDYISQTIQHGYAGDLAAEKSVKTDNPKVISPDEFGEAEGYETISLTYYADGVLTDDSDDVIEDVEKVVGRESLNRFGEYEDDSVFVRNDKLKCDFEILLDLRKYSDVFRTKPHPAEED